MYDVAALDTIGGEVTATYERAELFLIRVIRDALAKMQDEPDWARAQLLAIRQERYRVEGAMAVLQRQAPELALKTVDEAYVRGALEAEREIAQLANAGIINPTTSMTLNDAAVVALSSELVSSLAGVNGGILRRVEDIWRTIVAEATGYSVTGAMTTFEAAQRSYTRMAREGLGFFVDSAGRKWSLDTYAEMATRTATTKALMAGHTDRMVQSGVDLVVVSSHPNPAPQCAPFERKVLSLTGRDAGRIVRDGHAVTVTATLDQAIEDGLFHPNCRHTLSAYVPGATNLTPPKPDKDHAGYKATQHQRYLERQVRASKRMEAAAVTPEAKQAARQRARAYQARIREHVAKHNLPRRRHREQLKTPGGRVTADYTPRRNAKVIPLQRD